MKKVLSLVLVLAMVLSSMSFAFASTFEDIADTDYAEAIETLTALGIVDGYEDGTFRPEKTITRAEMAKLMVVTLGYGDLVAGSKSNFADTQGHWADAYIALAAGKGIVIGTGDGKFTPDRTVSYDEAITMLVRGLGYTDDCNELKGMTWPTNFKVKAAELDITDDVVMSASGADRGGVAQLIANSLEATLVTVTTDGDVTFLQDTVNTGKDTEKVDRLLITRVATPEYSYEVTADKVDPKNKNFAGEVVDLGSYMFQNLQVYLNDDDQVVYVKDTNSLVLEGVVDDVVGKTLSVENLAGKIIDIDFDDVDIDNNDVFENGSIKESDIKLAYLLDKAETIKVVATDAGKENGKIEDNEIEGFIITVRTDVVRIEKTYVDGKTKIDGIVLPEDDDKADLENITVKGAAESLEDIKEDDIVVVYASEDDTAVTLVVSRETIEGKVTRVVDADTYYVDGTKYDLASDSIVKALELGDEGSFFLDQEGEIADYDGESVGPQDYAVVVGVANGTTDEDRFTHDESVDDYPSLKLATQEDEELVLDIEVDVTDAGIAEDSAEDENGKALVKGELVVDKSVVDKDYLIKYKLNKDGRISEIDVVTKLTSDSYKTVDLDKSSNALVSDAIIFDAGDDYAVVNENKLPTKVEAFVVRNSSGEITVLVAEDGQVESAAEKVYVYVEAVDQAYDKDGDEIQVATVYTDGAKAEVETTDDDIFKSFKQGVYAVEYDGEKIDEATREVAKEVVTADTVNAKGNMIEVKNVWYSMSENATVVAADVKADGKYVFDDISDLYDIDETKTKIEIYANDDDDIDLIVIILSDARIATPEEITTEGTVTYITVNNIAIDNVVYTFDANSVMYNAAGTVVATGGTNIHPALLNQNDIVENIVVESGVVKSLKLKVDASAAAATVDAMPLTTPAEITAARTAYDALAASVKLETAAVTALGDIETAEAGLVDTMITTIAGLTTPATAAEIEAVEDARAAYVALTAGAKAKVTPANLTTLAGYEATIASEAVVKNVIDAINALPATITLANKTAVVNARAAYNALTGAQRTIVDADAAGATMTKLTNAETTIANLEAMATATSNVATAKTALTTLTVTNPAAAATIATPAAHANGATYTLGAPAVITGNDVGGNATLAAGIITITRDSATPFTFEVTVAISSTVSGQTATDNVTFVVTVPSSLTNVTVAVK